MIAGLNDKQNIKSSSNAELHLHIRHLENLMMLIEIIKVLMFQNIFTYKVFILTKYLYFGRNTVYNAH